MDNGLAVFEGVELEILTKEDVNVEFNGECLFNGIQITDILGYSNGNRDIENHCDEDCIELITKDKLNTKMVLSLGQRGTKFINEDGVMDLIYNSKMPKAKDFKKKVRKIVKEVQATGKYDSVEQQLKLIEDEKERNLKLTIYQLDGILKINPSDMLTGIMRNQKQTELDTYLQSKELKSIKDSVISIDNKIKKTTVLREGDMSAEAIAKKFNIFSVTNKPHNKFAENLARVLGFYLTPDGNIGYQDDYISINLTNRGGTTISTIKYSSLAFEEMEKYINTDGLHFENPPVYYKRKCKGGNVGDFNYGRIIFDDIEESIKVNKITYDLYNNKDLEEF